MRDPSSINDNFSRFLGCSKSIARYIRRRVKDPEVAAELFQDVSILLLAQPGEAPAGEDFERWCRGIARNVLAHHFRTQRRQVALLSRAEPEGHTLLAQGPRDPEHTFATRELLSRIFDHIDERSRGLMIERYLMGRSADEIAKKASQSPTAVRMKLMRVRGAVKSGRPKADSRGDNGSSD